MYVTTLPISFPSSSKTVSDDDDDGAHPFFAARYAVVSGKDQYPISPSRDLLGASLVEDDEVLGAVYQPDGNRCVLVLRRKGRRQQSGVAGHLGDLCRVDGRHGQGRDAPVGVSGEVHPVLVETQSRIVDRVDAVVVVVVLRLELFEGVVDDHLHEERIVWTVFHDGQPVAVEAAAPAGDDVVPAGSPEGHVEGEARNLEAGDQQVAAGGGFSAGPD